MKKILIGLVFAAYAISSFIGVKYFETNETAKMTTSQKTEIYVSNWVKNERPEVKLEKIGAISKKEDVNIYKFVYPPSNGLGKQRIVIYASISDWKKFKKEFPLKWGNIFSGKKPYNQYLSSSDERNKRQTGRIELFSPNTVIQIKPMLAAKNENMRGLYVIESNHSKVVQLVKNQLKTNVGFKFGNTQSKINTLSILTGSKIRYLIIALVILLILIALSFLYFIFLNYKEFAVRKLFGYADRELIFKRLMKENIEIHAIAFALLVIGQCVFLFFYNRMDKVQPFGLFWLKWELLFTLVSMLVSFLPFLMVSHISIADMLKNRKPLRLVQFLNYGSKLVFSVILVILFINLYSQYHELMRLNGNHDKWDSTKHYSFYDFQDTSNGDRQKWEYQTGLKSQKLFKLASEQGAILIKPSDGIVFKKRIQKQLSKYGGKYGMQDVKTYDPQDGNVLQVNANYLKKNPVYDTNGDRIQLKEDYGDYLIVLVPNHYRNEKEVVLKAIKKWYQFKRYINKDMHLKEIGKKPIAHKPVKLKLIFIKDGQKHFLYNPHYNKKKQNYGMDSLLMVINSENIGGDSYLNYLTGSYFFPRVKDTNHPFSKIKKEIQLSGLNGTIFSTPILYSVIGEYLYNLHNQISLNLFLVILLIGLEIIITVFLILNYLERTKQIHSVQKIHGFSFWRRHYQFFGLMSLFWLVICFSLFFAKILSVSMMIWMLPICLLFELLMMFIIVRLTENKKTLSVLKGA